MASYHISDQGPRICKASVGLCPYGKRGEPHFDDIQSAQTHYESDMATKHGLVGSSVSSKNKESDYFKFHNYLDRLEVKSPAVKTARDFAAYRRHAPTNRNVRRTHAANSDRSAALRGNVRSKMHRQGFGGQISKMATRGGKEIFKAVGSTPHNVKRFYRALDREVKTLIQ